ncbi:MAG: carbohydrate porin [Candidatus Omnitrophota bacterium]
MRSRRYISGLLAIFFMQYLFFPDQAVGQAVPANQELFREIMSLKKIVEEQGEMIERQNKRIAELEARHGEVEKKVEEQDKKIGEFAVFDKDISERLKGQLGKLETAGVLEVGAGVTFVGQGTSNANAAGSGGNGSTEDSRFDASYSADIEIAKEFGDYGLAFVHLETGDGDTLEGDLSVYPGCGVNRDADRSGNALSLTEAWYEHDFFDKQVVVTGGKIDATAYIDTNEFANDETTQFLGSMFRNSPAIEFPDNNIGGRVYITSVLFPAVDIGAVYLEGDGDWEEVFNKPFAGAQVSFMPEKAFNLEESMWRGKYRAYFWYNGTDHTRLKDEEKNKEHNYGFGLSCDQNVTDVFGVFERFGWQNPEVSTIEYHWSFGGQMTGKYWKREEDKIAVAVGQAIPGRDYRDTAPMHKNETHFEAYYSYKVNEHLTFSPDLQCLWDVDGDRDEPAIFIYGIRGQIDL